jgi:hypothetical protein
MTFHRCNTYEWRRNMSKTIYETPRSWLRLLERSNLSSYTLKCARTFIALVAAFEEAQSETARKVDRLRRHFTQNREQTAPSMPDRSGVLARPGWRWISAKRPSFTVAKNLEGWEHFRRSVVYRRRLTICLSISSRPPCALQSDRRLCSLFLRVWRTCAIQEWIERRCFGRGNRDGSRVHLSICVDMHHVMQCDASNHGDPF